MNTFYPHFEPRWNNRHIFTLPLENIKVKLIKYGTMIFKALSTRQQRRWWRRDRERMRWPYHCSSFQPWDSLQTVLQEQVNLSTTWWTHWVKNPQSLIFRGSKGARVCRQSTEQEEAMQRENPEEMSRSPLSLHQNIDPDRHMSELPNAEERTSQRIKGNRAQRPHMAWNGDCSHQWDWKTSLFPGLWVG